MPRYITYLPALLLYLVLILYFHYDSRDRRLKYLSWVYAFAIVAFIVTIEATRSSSSFKLKLIAFRIFIQECGLSLEVSCSSNLITKLTHGQIDIAWRFILTAKSRSSILRSRWWYALLAVTVLPLATPFCAISLLQTGHHLKFRLIEGGGIISIQLFLITGAIFTLRKLTKGTRNLLKYKKWGIIALPAVTALGSVALIAIFSLVNLVNDQNVQDVCFQFIRSSGSLLMLKASSIIVIFVGSCWALRCAWKQRKYHISLSITASEAELISTPRQAHISTPQQAHFALERLQSPC